jgi:hypothetical protein
MLIKQIVIKVITVVNLLSEYRCLAKHTRTENVFVFPSEINVRGLQFVEVLTLQPPAGQNHGTFGCSVYGLDT